MTFDEIISVINNANKIALFPHIDIDGDALGSCLALYIALKRISKNVEIFIEEDIPSYYQFLPFMEEIKDYHPCIDSFDLGISLDLSDTSRLGKRYELFKRSSISMNIDHHHTNINFADYNYVNSTASATGEIIFSLIEDMKLNIDKDIATCLYIAISSDTGGFRYSNTTSLTHSIAAKLLGTGISVSKLSDKIFSTFSMQKMKLFSLVINSINFFDNGKIMGSFITRNMIKYSETSEQECTGIISMLNLIKDIDVFFLLCEKADGSIKVSLRSKNEIDVSKIAMMYSGGGHKKAAGFTAFDQSLDEVSRDIVNQIIKQLHF